MKKIISAVLLVSLLFTSLLALASCGGDGSPAGMQLVRGSDALGYYFYGPEEWVVANHGEIAATYASKLDNSSITFVEAEPVKDLDAYVQSEIERLPFEYTVTAKLKECEFGNADKAYSIAYKYKYGNYNFSTMQIFVTEGERFFIFTYTAQTVKYSEEETYYEFYLEKVEKVIAEFKFVEVSGEATESEKPEYEKDEDGWSLVSDKSICYFDLWVPEEYTVDFATSMVSVSRGEGVNINISEATQTNTSDDGYWKTRLEELKRIATDVEETSKKAGVDLGGGLDAVSLEYKFTIDGTEYRVYQVLIVNGFRGFVYTYQAEADVYSQYLNEAKEILAKVKF